MGTEHSVIADRGTVPIRLTTAERNAVSTPETGLEIYNTTENRYEFYDGSTWRFSQSLQIATVSTADATVTTIDTIAIPTDSIVMIEISVVARRTGGTLGSVGDGGTSKVTVRFKNIAGTVTRHNESADYTSEDQPVWNVSTVVSGTNALIQVKGSINNNVNWRSETTIRSIT